MPPLLLTCSKAVLNSVVRTIVKCRDEAMLACSMYVDLNVIRAGKAPTPEESRYTSAYERIMELKRCREAKEKAATQVEGTGAAAAVSEHGLWLSPIELADRYESLPMMSQCNVFPSRRLTNKGFLPMTLEHYLSLLDWAGRQVRVDKRGSIPADLAGILDRLKIKPESLPDLVSGFGKRFHSAVGRVDNMGRYARRLGRRWIEEFATRPPHSRDGGR